MDFSERQRACLRLWILLTAAFFVTIAAGGFAVVELTVAQIVGEQAAGIRTVGTIAVLLVSVLGAAFAAILTRAMLTGPTRKSVLRALRSRGLVRRSGLEMLLATFAGTVVVVGLGGMLSMQRARVQRSTLEGQARRVESLQAGLARAVVRGHDLAPFAAEAQALGIAPGVGAADLLTALDAELASVWLRRDALRMREEGSAQGVNIAFSISALLTLGALVLLRATCSREQELEDAEHTAAKTLSTHRQVAEGLPIGFYTYGGGDRIEFCNDAWSRLMEREEGEEPAEALARALHPEDREVTLAALRDAAEGHTGFGFGHRVVGRAGEIRHVETRGVPIHDERGGFEHMVAFAIDVTARVRSRRLLEEKTFEVEATNERLRKAMGDLEENLEATVHTLVKAVEAKDPYTAGHSERVMRYAVRIGEALGLSPHELRVLRMGTLIHDIGKIGVPDDVLTKPGPLSPDELDLIRAHPVVGARVIDGIPTFRECAPIILLHHERLDGQGYPYGISGDAIPLMVRIASVADCFDAMTSDRAYRQGRDPARAIAELFRSANEGALDGRIVSQLADIVRKDGTVDVAAPYRHAA